MEIHLVGFDSSAELPLPFGRTQNWTKSRGGNSKQETGPRPQVGSWVCEYCTCVALLETLSPAKDYVTIFQYLLVAMVFSLRSNGFKPLPPSNTKAAVFQHWRLNFGISGDTSTQQAEVCLLRFHSPRLEKNRFSLHVLVTRLRTGTIKNWAAGKLHFFERTRLEHCRPFWVFTGGSTDN